MAPSCMEDCFYSIIAARKIGRETVRYVRNVFKYYVAYQLAAENREARQAVTADAEQ